MIQSFPSSIDVYVISEPRAPPLEEIQAANRQFRIHRKWSKRTALDKWREDWLDDRYQKTIQSEGMASHDRSTDIDRVQALFRIMPERARLADMIVSNDVATRDQICWLCKICYRCVKETSKSSIALETSLLVIHALYATCNFRSKHATGSHI